MRIHKYRALDKDGVWYYGIYPYLNVDMGNTVHSLAQFFYSLLPNLQRQTLGEYTGLKDKNGVEIYDSDIVTYDYDEANDPHGIRYSTCKGMVRGTVAWLEDGWSVLDTKGEYDVGVWSGVMNCRLEVIGNIYQNLPEKG